MQQQWQSFLSAQGGFFSEGKLIHFGDLEHELKAIDKQNCITSLSSEIGLLHIAGPDAKSFLQGQITCNVSTLSSKKSHLGAHCNLKGRMQSLFSLFANPAQEPTDFYLKMPASMLTFATQSFKKFAIFSKVTFEDMSSNMVAIGLYGPDVDTILTDTFSVPALDNHECHFLTSEGTAIVCRLPGDHPRYEIFASMETLQTLWPTLKKQCQMVTPESWQLLDIRAGLPAVYPRTIDEILPHHANLSILDGISYDKGCYIGQEIIARMQYRGKIKKHMYRAHVESNKLPLPGDAVYVPLASEEALGLIVRASHAENGGFELLVVLDDQYASFENVHLYSADGPKLHRLELPYKW